MKLLLEVDLENNTAIILKKSEYTADEIIAIVADYFGLNVIDFEAIQSGDKGFSTKAKFKIRIFTTYYLINHLKMDQKAVAVKLNYTNRSTVSYNLKRFNELIAIDKIYQNYFKTLNKILWIPSTSPCSLLDGL